MVGLRVGCWVGTYGLGVRHLVTLGLEEICRSELNSEDGWRFLGSCSVAVQISVAAQIPTRLANGLHWLLFAFPGQDRLSVRRIQTWKPSSQHVMDCADMQGVLREDRGNGTLLASLDSSDRVLAN
jgi:hypothetical protein